MKELSLEDKAKRYDEAIKVAQRFYNNSVAITKKGLEDIFPELKESEDEEIKEMLKVAVERTPWMQNKKEKCYEWLEKQVEQKSYASETMNEKGDFNNGFTRMVGKEQNHAWSEEDEEMLRRCISVTFDHGYLKECDWLKFLKERVLPQPKQEWSEKDRRMLIGLIDELDAIMNKATPNEISVYSKYINWLKSLRPQSTWKPSDEQMEALDDVISSREIRYDVLSKLWKDLKELKE